MCLLNTGATHHTGRFDGDDVNCEASSWPGHVEYTDPNNRSISCIMSGVAACRIRIQNVLLAVEDLCKPNQETDGDKHTGNKCSIYYFRVMMFNIVVWYVPSLYTDFWSRPCCCLLLVRLARADNKNRNITCSPLNQTVRPVEPDHPQRQRKIFHSHSLTPSWLDMVCFRVVPSVISLANSCPSQNNVARLLLFLLSSKLFLGLLLS